jgi:hypothetical protein
MFIKPYSKNHLATTRAREGSDQNQLEAAGVEKPETKNEADIVTIAEARESLGPDAPTPNAFHKACERGQLKKQPQQEGGKAFRFLWGDILEWRARGETKKRVNPKKKTSHDATAASETEAKSLTLLDPAPLSLTPDQIGGGPAVNKTNRTKDAVVKSTIPPTPAEEPLALEGVGGVPVQGSALGADELVPLRKIMSTIDMMGIKTVEKVLGEACKAGAKNSEIAVKASVMVATYAWITGKLILRAKSLLKKKGEFGEWCDNNLVKPGLMSVKTAQRYMAVAKKWDSLEALLAGVPNLWSAYQEAGVLPVPADFDDADDADDADDPEDPEIPGNNDDVTGVPPVSIVAEYVAEFSKLQKTLRRLGEMSANVAAAVPKAEQEKIDLVIEQIIKFATQIRDKSA